MSSERGGLLKTRAENFARHLQTRLRSLSDSENGSWTAEVSSSSDTEVYYDIDSSLASPEEEAAEPIFVAAQNLDSLQESHELQRSDSSGSQYYDTVEEQTTPSPTDFRKIPILHLKSDGPLTVTNGHAILLDADIGCSRVREMPSLELKSIIGEKTSENQCGNNSIVENNNRESELEEMTDTETDEQPCTVCSSDVVVEVDSDTRQDGDCECEKELLPEAVQESSEPKLNGSDSFCVFCDIEQIKSDVSNTCAGNGIEDISHNEEIEIDHCDKNELEKEPGRIYLEIPLISEEPNNFTKCSSHNDENISLTDLLQVLKKEIASETEQNRVKPELEQRENNNTSQAMCPSIEVRESSPVTGETKVKEKEDEVFDIDTKRKNFRRCSSLKSGKTPPGTPGRKKIVRFADVLGLDLANVKTFQDEVPTIPKSAYEDLCGIEPLVDSPRGRVTVVTALQDKILVPFFQQPSVQPNFLDRVRENSVCLESAVVSDMTLFAISGVVRVKNIDFHKSVYVRYSINNWKSFSDLQARYVPNSCDGFSDKFSFVLYAHTLATGQRLEFAVRFHTAGDQFWDSNGGLNYGFECTTRGPLRTYVDPGVLPSPIENWASFY